MQAMVGQEVRFDHSRQQMKVLAGGASQPISYFCQELSPAEISEKPPERRRLSSLDAHNEMYALLLILGAWRRSEVLAVHRQQVALA
jgi:hypothetical protein